MSRIVFQLHSSIKKRLLEDKKTINKLKINLPMVKLCDPYRIQTCNLLIRSQMLYSVELRGPCLLAGKLSEVENSCPADFSDFVKLYRIYEW